MGRREPGIPVAAHVIRQERIDRKQKNIGVFGFGVMIGGTFGHVSSSGNKGGFTDR
jgi:hypothetical protein